MRPSLFCVTGLETCHDADHDEVPRCPYIEMEGRAARCATSEASSLRPIAQFSLVEDDIGSQTIRVEDEQDHRRHAHSRSELFLHYPKYALVLTRSRHEMEKIAVSFIG